MASSWHEAGMNHFQEPFYFDDNSAVMLSDNQVWFIGSESKTESKKVLQCKIYIQLICLPAFAGTDQSFVYRISSDSWSAGVPPPYKSRQAILVPIGGERSPCLAAWMRAGSSQEQPTYLTRTPRSGQRSSKCQTLDVSKNVPKQRKIWQIYQNE